MTRQLAVGELKRDFRRVLDAAERGEATVVVRRDRPVARVVPYVGTSAPEHPRAERAGGLLSVTGLLADWDDFESVMADVVAGRQAAADRPLPELE